MASLTIKHAVAPSMTGPKLPAPPHRPVGYSGLGHCRNCHLLQPFRSIQPQLSEGCTMCWLMACRSWRRER